MKLAFFLLSVLLPAVGFAAGEQYDVRLVIKGPEIRGSIRQDQERFARPATRPATTAAAAAAPTSPDFFDGRLRVQAETPALISWGSFHCGVAVSRRRGGSVSVDLDLAGTTGKPTRGVTRLRISQPRTFALGSYVVSAEVRRSRPFIVPASFHRILDRLAAGQPFL